MKSNPVSQNGEGNQEIWPYRKGSKWQQEEHLGGQRRGQSEMEGKSDGGSQTGARVMGWGEGLGQQERQPGTETKERVRNKRPPKQSEQ